MSQWEMNEDQLNQILNKLVDNKLHSETIIFTDTLIRNNDLSKALDTSIFSAREVVKELNDLSTNQLSTYNQIEFSIVDTLSKVIEIKGFNTISGLSIDIKVNQAETLFLDEKLMHYHLTGIIFVFVGIFITSFNFSMVFGKNVKKSTSKNKGLRSSPLP